MNHHHIYSTISIMYNTSKFKPPYILPVSMAHGSNQLTQIFLTILAVWLLPCTVLICLLLLLLESSSPPRPLFSRYGWCGWMTASSTPSGAQLSSAVHRLSGSGLLQDGVHLLLLKVLGLNTLPDCLGFHDAWIKCHINFKFHKPKTKTTWKDSQGSP